MITRQSAFSRLANRPLALEKRAADAVFAAIETSASVYDDIERDYDRPFGLIEGVAVIPVKGALTQDSNWWFGGTTYNHIRTGFQAAMLASDVDAIVLDIDSPGGEVAGCFDLVDEIYSARARKPVWAILNENAFSAGYALASAAERIVVPRTGGVGSIGVMCMHVDFSKALSGAGVAVTYIQYGDRKTDGAPEKPLADEARARIQADIDAMGELFVETVARNRNLTVAKVRATEAATYRADSGVSLGLADAVMAPDAAFRELISTLA